MLLAWRCLLASVEEILTPNSFIVECNFLSETLLLYLDTIGKNFDPLFFEVESVLYDWLSHSHAL